MRKYRINRSLDGGGIRVDGSPDTVEAIKGVLMYHTPPTVCNPFNSQYGEDEWIALSFIDLTFEEPEWAYTILNKGKSNALEGFTVYTLGADPFNNVFTLRLRDTHSRDFTRKWLTYSFTHQPLNYNLTTLLTEVIKKNSSLPLIDPQIRASFPEPPSLSSIIETIKAKEQEKQKLIKQVMATEEIEAELGGNIDLEIWGGIIW